MNGFVKTLVFGLAAVGVLLLGGIVGTVMGLKGNGTLAPEKIRDFLLTKEEKTWLAEMQKRAEERPEATPDPAAHATHAAGHAPAAAIDQEALLRDLAELAHAQRASSLVEELRRQKDAQIEKEAWLLRKEGDIAAARADLLRVRAQLDQRSSEIAAQERAAEAERARFAALQAAEAERTRGFKAVEQARYAELAKLYELQKDDAWQTLRRLDPDEVARIIAQMESKKAARMLTLAQQDAEYQGMSVNLHRAMLRLNPGADSAAQLQRQAQLFSFMKSDDILPFLARDEPQAVADLLAAMAAAGTSDRKRSELLAAIRRQDPVRHDAIANLLKPAQPR